MFTNTFESKSLNMAITVEVSDKGEVMSVHHATVDGDPLGWGITTALIKRYAPDVLDQVKIFTSAVNAINAYYNRVVYYLLPEEDKVRKGYFPTILSRYCLKDELGREKTFMIGTQLFERVEGGNSLLWEENTNEEARLSLFREHERQIRAQGVSIFDTEAQAEHFLRLGQRNG